MAAINTDEKIPDASASILLNLRSRLGSLVSRTDFKSVRKHFIFVGYPRSGHSIIGALIDAHPEAICSHELDALYFAANGYSRNQIFWLIREKSKNFQRTGNQWNGHDYHFHSGFQGKTDTPEVIGDKKGGRSLRRINKDPDLITIYDTIMGSETLLVHVFRDPKENLLSRLKYRRKRENRSDSELMQKIMVLHESSMRTIQRLEKTHTILHLNFDQVIKEPEVNLAMLFNALSLSPQEKLMEEFKLRVDKSKTSSSIEYTWTKEEIDQLESWYQKFSFLKTNTTNQK